MCNKKLTYEFVKAEFAKVGYKLLEKEYIDYKTPMNYLCVKNHNAKISWSDFNRGHRCSQCYHESTRMDFEFVKSGFEKEGFTLLETEYINNAKPMNCLCIKKHECKITWGNFKAGQRCRKCFIESDAESKRPDFEFIKNEFKKAGCTLLETKYINCRTHMKYLCAGDHNSVTTWSMFKNGHRCKQCLNDRIRIKYEVVKEAFERNGCTLLSTTYINCDQKLKYICICGNKSYTTYDRMKNGTSCGCVKSHGERLIIKYLNENNIKYITQKTFPDCANKNKLRFDFYVKIDDDTKFLIEFDGRQHFVLIEYRGGEKAFSLVKKCDDIKNNYCIIKDIKLLRIPYSHKGNINKILDKYIKNFKDKNTITFIGKSVYEDMNSRIKNN